MAPESQRPCVVPPRRTSPSDGARDPAVRRQAASCLVLLYPDAKDYIHNPCECEWCASFSSSVPLIPSSQPPPTRALRPWGGRLPGVTIQADGACERPRPWTGYSRLFGPLSCGWPQVSSSSSFENSFEKFSTPTLVQFIDFEPNLILYNTPAGQLIPFQINTFCLCV